MSEHTISENTTRITTAINSLLTNKETLKSTAENLGLALSGNALTFTQLTNLICSHATSDLPYITSLVTGNFGATNTRNIADGLNVVDESYAEIETIEGNTVKCENLLKIPDVAETTKNGITYSIKDGIIKLNGTCMANFVIEFNFPSNEYIATDGGTYNVTVYSSKPLNWTSSILLYCSEGVFVQVPINNIVTRKSNVINVSTRISKVNLALLTAKGVTFNNDTFKIMLTKGETNPTEFQPFFTGLKNSKVTTLVSKNANGEVIDTITHNLELGKWQTIRKAVESDNVTTPYILDSFFSERAFQTGDVNSETMVTDGTTTTRIKLDTHTYTPVDLNGIYKAANGGTETIVNDNAQYGAYPSLGINYIINNNSTSQVATIEDVPVE